MASVGHTKEYFESASLRPNSASAPCKPECLGDYTINTVEETAPPTDVKAPKYSGKMDEYHLEKLQHVIPHIKTSSIQKKASHPLVAMGRQRGGHSETTTNLKKT